MPHFVYFSLKIFLEQRKGSNKALFRKTISPTNNTEVFFGICLFYTHSDCLTANLIELDIKAILNK